MIPTVSDFVEIGEVCCTGCELSNLNFGHLEVCNSSNEFELVIDFDYIGTTNDFFDWEVLGIDDGFALFEDLPITVGVENDDIEVLMVIICENDKPKLFV